MISFFRKIRKRLLSDGKAGRYLKYAFGEIILVVIGILIALSINNWNENRKERVQEALILQQLLSDFKSNLEQLDQKISFRNDFMKASLELLKLIDEPQLRNKDSIDMFIGRTMPYATYDPIIVDLAGSGELGLIQNTSLKRALTHWSSNIKDVIEDEVIWKEYRNNQYFPFLVKHYQLRTIRNKAFESNLLGRYSLEVGKNNESYIDNNIGVTKHAEDFNGLLDQPDFEDHLTRCYSINSWANVQSEVLRERIVEMIQLIEVELEK